MSTEIFVFGSNLAGRHGKGAAKDAFEQYGAKYGQAYGLQGEAFAIPTKDEALMALPLHKIKLYVDAFLTFANEHDDMEFFVTRIGCGLAGYSDEDIAPMFAEAPYNCRLPEGW